MQDKKRSFTDFMPEDNSVFKKGLAVQREQYKAANIAKYYDVMVSVIENLLCELEDKIISKGNKKDVLRVKKIIRWYKKLPDKYTIKLENGYDLQLPDNIEIKISHNLNVGYKILIKQMSVLRLI